MNTQGNQGNGAARPVYYNADPTDLLRFQHQRIVTTLFKTFLVVLEDLAIEHDTALDKLHDKLPEQYKVYVDLADYLDEEKRANLRAKVLGAGNDAKRQLEDLVNQFDIRFKS